MRKLSFIMLALLLAACTGLRVEDVYGPTLHTLEVHLSLPEEYAGLSLGGITVKVTDINMEASYTGESASDGVLVFRLPEGLYRLTTSAKIGELHFNAAKGGIILSGSDRTETLNLKAPRFGDIVIKELYNGGCKKLPAEGNFQSDKYFILHNNSNHTVFLDSLCFGTLSPYNSTGTNVWGEGLEFVPIIQCVWQFPGDGASFPLASGADAVVVVNGAVDHTKEFPLSVNLNNEEYFVCYNSTYFTNTIYHPAPGDLIRKDHILNVVIKTGQANAYPLSVSSPTLVLFRTEGMSIQAFIAKEGTVIQEPGNSVDKVVCVPEEWVEDGMEVFDGRSSLNNKRLGPMIDAGYVYQSDTYTGHSLMRRVDTEKSAAAGYEILVDTNNSTNDFYETEKQSLHD